MTSGLRHFFRVRFSLPAYGDKLEGQVRLKVRRVSAVTSMSSLVAQLVEARTRIRKVCGFDPRLF